MSLSRRDFLRLGGLTAVTATATACSAAGRFVAENELPETLLVPEPTLIPSPIDDAIVQSAPAVDPILRVLNRAGYGPRPGDIERVRQMGLAAYVEEQLQPAAIEDTAADLLRRNLTVYNMDVSQLVEQDPRDGGRELVAHTIINALYSKRQLYEAVVEFWSDHFNIYLRKNQYMPLFKLVDDRDVIRPHALGKFRNLLFASAKSPAMLIYLDNVRNLKEDTNENYARELMELHTLGVHGGYTQTDVEEVARVLTGWQVQRRGLDKGEVIFRRGQHDNGEKTVLGHHFPAGRGEAELDDLLEILATHPSTANFIATKMVRRFVADQPPQTLVDRVADIFLTTDGDIKAMLREIFMSPEFAEAPAKLKRPFTYFISTLRALHTDLGVGHRNARQIGRVLEILGQLPFHWPPPNGYPDVAPAWATNLLPRWNFALALLHDNLPGTSVPLEEIVTAGNATDVPSALHLFAHLLFGRGLDGETAVLFQNYIGQAAIEAPQTQERFRDTVAFMLASPEFQWT
ncbi:MAG: DUF1800 domain-containing protein [Chloroflexota bacterium]